MTNSNDTRKIPLTQGKFAIVDAEDYDYLMQWKWRYNKGYAVNQKYIKKINGKDVYSYIRMHRLINKTPYGLFTDHINRNKLDNRKCNLRSCTSSQNQMNQPKIKGETSKYKGVNWRKERNKWRASISANRKQIFIGHFTDEVEAARAYNKAAKELHGEFAYLNDID